MKNSDYFGVIAAMITPCKNPGVPDSDGTTRLARSLAAHGCHGLFVLGSTGELPFLDEDQRREVVVAARKGVGDTAKIYAGVSGTGVKQIVRYAINAAHDGADVAISMAPFFLKTNQDGLFAYISEIADGSPIPVGIYNNCSMPSIFEIDTLVRLARHPNIVAIKDSSAEAAQVVQLVHALKEIPVSIFQGREPFLLESFASGAEGCVSALANVAPEWHKELYDAVAAGEMKKAAEFQAHIQSLFRIFELDEVRESFAGFAYALRCAMQYRGWIDHTDGMTSGFRPSAEFAQSVYSIIKDCGLVKS